MRPRSEERDDDIVMTDDPVTRLNAALEGRYRIEDVLPDPRKEGIDFFNRGR